MNKIVSEEELIEASKALLGKEKEFTTLRTPFPWVVSTTWNIDPWPNAFAGEIKSVEIK